MKKLSRGRLLLSTCLSGVALAWGPGALAQDQDPNWKPRAEVDARAADGNSQVSFELFAPLAQNDSNLLFAAGRIGTDERYDRNGSVTLGGRGKIGEDVAIGVNAGVDFFKSDISKRDQAAVSFGLEGFTSVFDLRVNYRLPVTNRSTIGYLDPNASPVGVLSIENNRLIERKSGWRLEDVPLGGASGEIGARAPLAKYLSVRASGAGFDYRDEHASKAYRGVRGGLELDIEDPLGTGGRFSLGAELQNDNRWGTQARGTLRLSIPLGRGSRDRSAGTTGLDRQMGDRVRRDYATPSGTRFTDLTSTSFAVDARTGQEFGGVYYTSGAAAAAGAGTSTSPTTLGDAIARAGNNGIIVALGGAGSIASGGVTLATNQYLVGGASSVDVRHANGTVTAFSFGGTNGTIMGSNAGGAAVTLGQGSVVRDVTVRGAGSGILANGVGGFSLERVTIENTGAAGLTLTNTTGAVVIDGITIRGGAGAGVVVNGGSNVTLRNSTIGGGAGAIDINDAGGNLTASLSNLALSATGGTVLDIDGSGAGTVTVAGLSGITIAGGNGETGGFAARTVTFDSSTAAGVQAVNAGTMQVGTVAARVGGAGVSITESDGALGFANLDIANNGGTGLTVNNTKSGTFTLTTANGTTDTTGGAALNLDPLLIDLTFTSVRSVNSTGAGVVLDNVQGAGANGNALTIGTLTILNSALQGLLITGGSTGLITIGGGTITDSGGASVQVGESGVAGSGGTASLTFGGTITDSSAGQLVSLYNIGGTIRFTGAISGAGPVTINGSTAGSSVSFTGTTTITGATSPALSFDNLAGSTSFAGTVTIANPAGTGIVIGNVSGGVTFGDVDITGLGTATGVNFTGTHGNVTFATLDITGTGAAGSTGIDLSGATNGGAITIAGGSIIQGVDFGVNLTNAAITGSFRFGDANAANGLQSRITANTVILVAGMNATQGIYNFADVELDGDTNNITGGSFTSYYVLAGATGAGTQNDPGSLAGAAASGAQYIVLLNDPTGGQDVLDTASIGGALTLTTGQSLVSFLNTDFFAITGATVPANLIVTNLAATGLVNSFAGSGAAILTSSTGSATVSLASDTRLDGLIIQSVAGTGVVGTGVSNVILRNSIISGGSGAVSITDGGAAASVTLSNLDLSAGGGIALALNGTGAGTLNVSGTDLNITATGNARGAVLTDVTVGTLDIDSIATGTTSFNTGAIQFDRVAGGTVNLGSATVAGTNSGPGLRVLNSSATMNIGPVTVANTSGNGVMVQGNTGNVTLGAVSVANSGGDGVYVSGNGGRVTLGALTIADAGNTGLRVSNNSGIVTIASAAITNAGSDGANVTGVSGNFSIGSLSVSGSGDDGMVVNGVTGSATFTGTTTIANSGQNGLVLGAGTTGTIRFGDVDITGVRAGYTGLDARDAEGTTRFATLDITGASASGTRGIDLSGANFAGSLTVGESSSITGVGTGVDLTNAAITGSFVFGDGSNTDADGAASTIDAITPISIAGLDTGQGSYDFADVRLVGDLTGLGTNPVSLFFVEEGRTGAGTKTDPGSLAAAAASGAQVIILLNNPAGGTDTLDVAGSALALASGQRLIGFLNGDTQTTGGGLPANLFLYGITPGIVTNPYAGSGAALLTNSGAGATVTLSSGSSIDGVRIGGAGLGVYGSGVANVSITNSVISGGTGALQLRDDGFAASATLTNLALSATGGTVLDLNGGNGGSLSLRGSGITVNATGDAGGVLINAVTLSNDLSIGAVSTQVAAGAGVELSYVAGPGRLSFASIDIAGTSSDSGIRLLNNSAAIDLGAVTVANTASSGIDISANGGDVALGNFTISGAAAHGIRIDGLQGSFTALGGTIASSYAGVSLANIAGSVSFTGDVSITNPITTGISLTDIFGSASFGGGVTITNPGATGISLANIFGSAGFAGDVTITNPGTTGISLANIAGSAGFGGGVTITNPGATGIMLDAGSAGTTSFGDTDITGLGANATGLDARNADGIVSFATLDIAGSSTSGTRGIDLTGATFGGSLIVANSSTITGVGIGVDLSGAAITGSFRYGDGSNTDANGAGSTISALTPIAIGGLDTTIGTYDFADVNLSGDTSLLAIDPVRVFFVEQGRTGAGTQIDPGSIAAAMASNAQVIILLNNPAGGNDTIDMGASSLTLDANQRLIGFLNGDTQNVGGGAPANLFLYGITPGIVTNPYAGSGAALLTDTGAGATVLLASGASIDGVRIGGSGLGVYGAGVANISITNSIIAGGAGAIDLRDSGAAASATLTNLALSSTGGTVLSLLGNGGGSLTVNGSGLAVVGTGNARGVTINTVTLGGNLSFDTVSTQVATSWGVSLGYIGGGGTLGFGSITLGGSTGSGITLFNNGAAIDLGDVTIGALPANGIDIANNAGNIALGNFAITGAGSTGIIISGLPGSFTALGGTIANSFAGISLANIAGSASFTGGVTITNPGWAGISIGSGNAGTIGFGDTDITGLGANTTGLDARFFSGDVTFATLDITGTSTSGTRGIDLTGANFAGNLIVAGSSTITGVGTGVDLTNAAITGNFRYGDGSNTDANGAGSTISATVPIVIAGLNAGVGSYDFADVNLVGDTSALSTSATTYWVLEGATGAGTRSDPGSLAGAAASGADVIILVNNPAGGTDTLDANDPTYGSGGTFTLVSGQQLRGFLAGDTIALPGGTPANVLVYNLATGVATNPFAGSGAPTLTTSAGGGANTVVVANDTVIDGVVIANGGTGSGVYGSGASNVAIRNSAISGADSAIDFSDGGAAASIALSNLHLWGNNGVMPLLVYSPGGGSTTVTQLSDIVIEGGHGENGGAFFNGAIFDADLATAGYQTVNGSLQIGSAAARLAGEGLVFMRTDGALNLTGVSIYSAGTGLRYSSTSTLDLSSTAGTIDSIGNSAISLNNARVDLVLDRVAHSGAETGVTISGLTGIGTGGRALQVGTLDVSSTTGFGVAIGGNVTGGISFGAGSNIANTAAAAILIASGSGILDFRYDGGITQSSNAELLSVAGHTGTITFGATSTLSATAGTGMQFTNADGTYAFNGTTTLNGGAANIDILGGSSGTFTFGAGTTITNPSGTAITVDGSTASLTYSGTISHSAAATNALSITDHSTGTLDFSAANLNITGGNGLVFDNADGTYAFGTATLTGGAAIGIANGSSGTFTFGAGTSVTDAAVTAFNIASSTADVTYSGTISQASGTTLNVAAHSGGTLDFSAANLSVTGGTGLLFSDAGGTYRFGTAALTGGAGVGITNSAGSFTFGTGTSITDGSGTAFLIASSTANVTYSGTISQALAGTLALSVTSHSGGTLDFAGATIDAAGGDGIAFNDADGTYGFGEVTLAGGARLSILGGSAGAFTFGDVDITGLAANTTAVDLTGATGNVTFATLDISAASATGTRGIDLTGSTTAGNVIVSGSSSMSGLGIGVDLTNAAIAGNFRYGDGSNTDANGAASNIAAVTPLIIAGLNGGTGNYNFADVNMTGDTSSLSVSAYFVLDGATGIGSRSDPGSLAGAEAAGATYIVLLNDPTGGTDILDATAGAGGSFDLDGGQILYSFRNTDSFTVGGGAPANVVLYNVQTGIISNPFAGSGAPTLTASGTNATLTLGGNNIVDGVVIANSGTGAGVLGNAAAGTNILRNSTIQGGAAAAVRMYDGAANTIIALQNLTLSGNGGNILNLDGTGAGTLTVSALSGLSAVHAGETGGFTFADVAFDSDPTVTAGLQPVSAGNLTLGTSGARIAGTALSLSNVTGTLNFADLNIANTGGTGLIVANSKSNNFLLGTTGGTIDTTGGTAINLDPLTVNMTLGSVSAAGGDYGILLDDVEGYFTVTGAANLGSATTGAIVVRNNAVQGDPLDVSFQGAVTINSGAGAGVSLLGNDGAAIDFTGGLGITTTTGTGFGVNSSPVSVTGSGNTITVGDAEALILAGASVSAAGVRFDNITAAPSSGSAIGVIGTSLVGALDIGGMNIAGSGTADGVVLASLTGAGGVNLTGTLNITGVRSGLYFNGAVGVVNVANVAGSTLAIDGTDTAIGFNVASGTVNIANGAGTASIGATTSSATAAIASNGGAGGTLNYGGTIRATTGSVLSVLDSSSNINLSGAINSTSGGTAFNFSNADGAYTVSGTVSHLGGGGVAINSTSAGSFTFSGASKGFNTDTSAAVTMAGTGTLSFTGGGLGIVTTSGAGFTASDGTIVVTGAGNTIQTGNTTALSLTGVDIGADGVRFASIASTPSAGNAVTVSNVALAGALDIGGLTVSGGGTAAAFSNLTGTGGVNLTGAIDIDDGIGFDFTGALGTINIANAAGSTLAIDGATTAVRFNGVTSGTVNIASGAGTASIGATASSTAAAIAATGNIGGTLSYGGTIRATTGSVLSVLGDAAAINLSGAITSTTGGTAFNFSNADGSYTVSGSVSHAGGAGIAIDDSSAGTITFSGASKAFSSGAVTAIYAHGIGTLALTGGGLDVDTTSGTGIDAGSSFSDVLIVTGANNSVTTATGRILAFNILTAGAGGINFASLGSTGTVAGNAISLANLQGTSFSGGAVNIAGTSAGNDGIVLGAGITTTVGFGATTIGAAGDNAIQIGNVGNTVNFASVNLAAATNTTVSITGAGNPVTIGAGTIAGGALAVDVAGGSSDISIAANLGSSVQIDNHDSGAVTFSGNISTGAGGITVSNSNGGTFDFTGATLGLGFVSLVNNTGATIAINPASGGNGLDIVSGPSTGFVATGGGTISVQGSGNSITSTTGLTLNLNNVTIGAGGINFASIATNGASSGILLNTVAATGGGALALGTVNLQGVTSSGIRFSNGFAAPLTIQDLDIQLNSSTARALDLNGATISGSILVSDFDVTNIGAAGTSIAVDLRGATGGGAVRLGDASAGGASSSILGVGTGIYFDGSTNLAFTYGDGETGIDIASSISASTAIDASAAPALGSYNFRDVAFSGSPGLGFGLDHIYFVDSNGATGGGNGSGLDGVNPATLAAIEALATSQDIIILVNNGNPISAAGSNGDDTLRLASNVQVRSFGDGAGGTAPVRLALTVPSTILLSGGSTVDIVDPTGNGAATLTSAAGANVITLGATGNHLSGFVLDGMGSAARGIKDNGAGATNTLIDAMTIRNFATRGIEITPSTSTTIDNVVFSGNAADVLLNAANSVLTNITGTGGGITLVNATGTTTLTNVDLSGGTGLTFTNAAGTINGSDVDLTDTGITISGGTADFNFDADTEIDKSTTGAALSITGHGTGTFAYAGGFDVTGGTGLQFDNADGTYNFTGTTILNGGDAGIDIVNGSGGTFGFGTGTSITHAAAGDAFVLTNSNAGLTYSGSINASNGYAVRIENHDAGTVTFDTGSILSSGAGAMGLAVVNSNGGTVNFNSEIALSTQTNNAVTLSSNAGGTIAFNAIGNGLDITTTNGAGFIIGNGGTINVLGSGNTIATGSGILLSVVDTTGATTALNLNFASTSNTLGLNGIAVLQLGSTITGTVDIAGGSITALNRGVDLDGDALAFSYGGSIATSGSAARSVEITNRTGGSATFSGNITDTSLGINVASNSGGTVNFTGQTMAISTVANATAVTLANNTGTAINFAAAAGGNGLDILASGSGTGIDFTGGGTLTVSGAGTSVQTSTGQILAFANGNIGALGATFDSLTSTGTVSGTAISISNIDGNALNGGNVSIAGTTGAGADGIFFGGGSTANLSFGNVAIANTADEGIEINGAGNGTFAATSVTIDNTGGNGVEINGSDNTVSLNGGAIGGTNDPTGFGVYVLNGTGAVNIGASIAKTTVGNVVFVDNHEANGVTFSGNISATGGFNNGIVVQNVNSGNVTFSGATKTLTTNANTAVNLLNNSGGMIAFTGGGLGITTTGGTAFSSTGGGTVRVTGSGNTITTGSGSGLVLNGATVAAGGVTFDQITTGAGSVINATTVNLAGALNVGGITSGGAVLFNNLTGTGGVNLTGTIDLDGGIGFNFTGTLGTINIANTAGSTLTIDGAATALLFNGVTSGTVNVASAAGTASIGATNSSTIAAIAATGDTGGTLNYGGSIRATTGAVLSAGSNSTAAITLSGPITSTTTDAAFDFSNADGVYTISGTVSHTGGAGVLVDPNSAGSITFSGTSKAFNAGSNTAIDMRGTGLLSITNGGLDIDTTSGTGIYATGGGTLVVTGSGNSVTTTTGKILDLTGVNIGASGVTFGTLTSTGTVGGIAINLNNVDGNTLNGGDVAIAGTIAGSDGIFYGGGSTTNASFGNVTIAGAGDEGIQINGAGNGTFTATSVTIDNTAGNGVEINDSDNTVSLNGGAIGGTNDPTGYGVYVLGGTGAVNIGASITKTTAGNVVLVDDHETGAVTFSGNISATGGFDNGIRVMNVNSGSITFSGAAKTISTGTNNGVDVNSSGNGAIDFLNGGLAITTTSGTGFTASSGAISVQGSGNTIQTATGQILSLTGASVGAGNMTFASLSSTGTVDGTAIDIRNLDGNTLNGGDVSIAGTSAGSDGIFFGNGSTANLSFGSVTIAGAGDEGIEVNGLGNGSFLATSATISNTGGSAIEINGADSSVTINGGAIGSGGNPGVNGVNVTGGSGAVSIGASITKTNAGNIVLVSGHTTGAVTFSGNLSATGGVNNGISVQNVTSGSVTFSGTTKTLTTGNNIAVTLNNNAGGTIAFTNGGLAITTTGGIGFYSSNSFGPSTVTVEGGNNTIASTTGTALYVSNSNIGSNGLTFRSISSNGAFNGIMLSGTGSLGGLRVTGTGAAGSGGTIQNSVGDGISLTNTENVRLAYMNVTNNLGDGIGGSNVNGFVIDNLLISGNGNDTGTDESGINIAELTGTASGGARPTGIFNSTIQNNYEFEVQVTNSTGTLSNFQIVNSTISYTGTNSASAHGNLVNFLGTGTSAMGLTVTGSTFTGNWNPSVPPVQVTGSGLFVNSSGTSMTANIATSNFYNNNNGINVSTGPGSTTLTYSIIGNTITGSRGSAINDFQSGNAPFTRTVYGTIQNNIIGSNGVALSGSQLGNGIAITNEGAVNATYLISGNTIQQIGQAATSGSSAIAVNVGLASLGTGAGTTSVTITNNVIRDILNSRGVFVSNNQGTGSQPTIRLSLSGNIFLGTIAGQAGNGQYIGLSSTGGSFFVTQQAASALAIASELDDANGFNDVSKIGIVTGTFTYGSAAPSLPPAVLPLP